MKSVLKIFDELKTASENKHKNKCISFILYIVLYSIIFTINVGIGNYFVYKYMNHKYINKDVPGAEFGTHAQTTI